MDQFSFSREQSDLLLMALAPIGIRQARVLIEELVKGSGGIDAESLAPALLALSNNPAFLRSLLEEFEETQEELRRRFDEMMAAGFGELHPVPAASLAFNILARAAFIAALQTRIEELAEKLSEAKSSGAFGEGGQVDEG